MHRCEKWSEKLCKPLKILGFLGVDMGGVERVYNEYTIRKILCFEKAGLKLRKNNEIKYKGENI